MIFKLVHLYFCIRHLGLFVGWRSWKLTGKACGNPEMVKAWSANCRKIANAEDVMKRHDAADLIRNFANELEQVNLLYHSRKNV